MEAPPLGGKAKWSLFCIYLLQQHCYAWLAIRCCSCDWLSYKIPQSCPTQAVIHYIRIYTHPL